MHSAVKNFIRGTRLALFAIPRQGVLGHVFVSRRLLYVYVCIYIYVNVLGGLSLLQWLRFVITTSEWILELSKHTTC